MKEKNIYNSINMLSVKKMINNFYLLKLLFILQKKWH